MLADTYGFWNILPQHIVGDEFLGISWEDLFVLCRAESSALKLAALDAYDAYEQHMEDNQALEKGIQTILRRAKLDALEDM